MKKHTAISILALSALLLSACQAALPPERPINQGDRPRVSSKNSPVTEEVLPLLQIEQTGGKSELKLRSQTSRYLTVSKSELEITLSSSVLAYCKNETPALKDGEAQIRITIKSADGKTPVEKTELAKNTAYKLSAVYKTPVEEVAIPGEAFESLKITDLNTAIARGHLKVNLADLKIEGEFFTAICR